ncbi:hypothetical protein [Chengkuizengella sediminis]|uniref:hypothetical protein n=1 Tax=Chengkuizengella sediminis TaxID=1885917 RepID=UPI00138A51DD|nr:hypothetical protein [Chengkuizengella sediminis]NDI37248.1 hypothetical protein [Chengkuizengella sediminis]
MKIKGLIITLVAIHMIIEFVAMTFVKKGLLSINEAFVLLIYCGIIGGLYVDYRVEEKAKVVTERTKKENDYIFYQYTK